jgi:sugar phosphate isomerase/epimerase
VKLAIGTTFDYSVPLAGQFAALAATPFDAASLGANLGHFDYLAKTAAAELAQLEEQSRLTVHSLHLPISPAYDISKADPESRMGAVCRVALVMAASVEIGCRLVILHLNHHAPSGYEQSMDALLSSLDVLIESAENMGVTLVAENLVSNLSHEFLCRSLATFDSSSYGFCYDSSHDQLGERAPYEILERYAHRLRAVHLSDNDGQEDRHWLPFTGKVDWSRICSILQRCEFSGPLLLEVENREKVDTELFLRQAGDAALRLRDMIESGG